MSTLHKSWSKVTFPNLPPAQGHASPSRKLVLLQIDHNYTVGVIYVYICIDCQSSILSHIVPELINHLICWNCKGCIGKSIGPVQYRFTIPSLLAQRLVAGSIFWTKNEKEQNTEKIEPATCPWASSVCRHHPGQYILCIRFLAFTFVRQLSVTFFELFFSDEKIEPARCHRARAMCLS